MPHCGRERIVGVNGSRRWCLNCSAEWPTAATFLAAVQSEPSTEPTTGREAIRNRLRQLISLVDTCPDEQLAELATWLTNLEMSLTFASK